MRKIISEMRKASREYEPRVTPLQALIVFATVAGLYFGRHGFPPKFW